MLELTHAPFLEEYLKAHHRSQLARYYYNAGKSGLAVKELIREAESDPLLSLQQRVDRLQNAKTIAADAQVPCPHIQILSQDLQEKEEVAEIQLEIFTALQRRDVTDGRVQSALETLNSKLLTMNQLFHQYAKQFRLHEEMLSIFDMSGHTTEDSGKLMSEVRRVWDELIRLVYEEYFERSILEFMNAIEKLVVRFHRSEIAFPGDFIIEKLERINFDVREYNSFTFEDEAVPVQWVYQVMLRSGLTYAALFDIYNAAFDNPARWQTPKENLHITAILYFLLKDWSTKAWRHFANARVEVRG